MQISKMASYGTKLNINIDGEHKVTEVGGGWILVYYDGKVICKVEHDSDHITSTHCTMETFKTEAELNTRIINLDLDTSMMDDN